MLAGKIEPRIVAARCIKRNNKNRSSSKLFYVKRISNFALPNLALFDETSGLAFCCPVTDGTTSNDEFGSTGPSQGDRIDRPHPSSYLATGEEDSPSAIADVEILFTNDLPRLKRTDTTLQWDFELSGVSPVRGSYNTSVLFDLDTKNLSFAVDDPSIRVVKQLSAECSCTEDVKPCVHQIFCLHYLRRQLSQRSRRMLCSGWKAASPMGGMLARGSLNRSIISNRRILPRRQRMTRGILFSVKR